MSDSKASSKQQEEEEEEVLNVKLPYDGLVELCYNSKQSPIYAELTDSSLVKLFKIITEHLPSNCYKTLIGIFDFGHGSGMALLKFATLYQPYLCNIYGIDVSKERVEISEHLIPKHRPRNVQEWKVECGDILDISNLPQCHVSYSFDKAFSHEIMEHMQKLQFKSYSLRFVITSRSSVYTSRPNQWEFIESVNAKTCGLEGVSCKMYVFKKILKQSAN